MNDGGQVSWNLVAEEILCSTRQTHVGAYLGLITSKQKTDVAFKLAMLRYAICSATLTSLHGPPYRHFSYMPCWDRSEQKQYSQPRQAPRSAILRFGADLARPGFLDAGAGNHVREITERT